MGMLIMNTITHTLFITVHVSNNSYYVVLIEQCMLLYSVTLHRVLFDVWFFSIYITP